MKVKRLSFLVLFIALSSKYTDSLLVYFVYFSRLNENPKKENERIILSLPCYFLKGIYFYCFFFFLFVCFQVWSLSWLWLKMGFALWVQRSRSIFIGRFLIPHSLLLIFKVSENKPEKKKFWGLVFIRVNTISGLSRKRRIGVIYRTWMKKNIASLRFLWEVVGFW